MGGFAPLGRVDVDFVPRGLCANDDDTGSTPTPSPVGRSGNGTVASMPLEERFISVLHRTLPKLPADIQDEFAAMLSPTTLAVIVGVLAVWAGSHYVGIGFIVDVVFVVVVLLVVVDVVDDVDVVFVVDVLLLC